MKWEIKNRNGAVIAKTGKVEYNDKWMEETYVSVTIESPCPVNFAIGDYIFYRGERFEINYDPGKIKSAPRFAKGDAFRYENIKFNSLADELTWCDFLDVVLGDNSLHFTGLPKFNFYGGVKQLAERIQANLDRAYGKNTWQVKIAEEFADTTELNVSVDTIKVSGALEILVNQFKAYYTISGRTITIGTAGVPADHLFKYGKGKGLYEIEQNAEADQTIVTRLRAYGSTRNIPHRYYNSLSGADGVALIPDNMAVQYLMLPAFPYSTLDPYIDSKNIDALGVREGTIFFDGSGELEEIYPSIEGMTANQLKAAGVACSAEGALDVLVDAEQMTDNGVGKIEGDAFEGNATTEAEPATFKVTIKDIGFDINEQIIAGQTPTLSFKTGMLGGREFEIVSCAALTEGTQSGYELELNRVYDEDLKLWFPYDAYNAKSGDKFVLLYIRMPEVYVKAASQRLLTAAKAWLSKNDYSRSVYVPKIDEIFMARQHDVAMASKGAIKSLHDTLRAGMQLLFEDEDLNIDAAIFIDQLTIIEGDGPIPTYEVVLKEEKTVGRLDKMQNQIDSLASGQGQGGGGYNASQIKSLISAYGGSMFLSKLKDDRSSGKIAADKGFEAGNYVEGLTGARIDGQGNAEVGSIKVREFAQFAELIVNRQTTIEGDLIASEGDTIEEVIPNADGTYTLRLHAEWDGYTTAQYENNVCRGIYNDITSGLPATEGKTTLHNSTYYTSWFRILTVNVAANTIDVVLYPDDEVPAGKNFPPSPMMKFARWGNSGASDNADFAMRQSVITISSTEGRIMQLVNVTKPIIDIGNVAFIQGKLPEIITDRDARLSPGEIALYVKTIVSQQNITMSHLMRPTPTLVFVGPYDPNDEYLSGDTYDEESGVYPRHIVEQNGCQWVCSKSGTKQEPSYTSTDWTFYLGDKILRVDFQEIDSLVDLDNPECPLTMDAWYMGQNVTDSPAIYYDWTRESWRGGMRDTASDTLWNEAHKNAGPALVLDGADMNFQFGSAPEKLIFTVTAILNDPSNPNLKPSLAQYYMI